MNKFQQKVKDLENTRIDYKIIEDFIKDYDKSNDNIFLISKFKENYNINQYYTRNLYEIIKKLLENNNFNDENTFLDFLENKLKETDSLSSLNRDIFIKLYLKLTKNTENVKKLYDEYIEKKYINVSTIEDFNEYFLKEENEIQYFIKSFLYDKEGWFRLHFFDYNSGFRKKFHEKILNFSKENIELFLNEISKQENINHLLQELSEDKENKFINDLIKKSLELNLENKLYHFLISQIKFGGNHTNYYSKNTFHKRNIILFNILKNKGTLNYQQFFKDIKYGEPGYYYYNDFEEFIFQTIENKNDLENLIIVIKGEEKEYFIRNGYFYIKYKLNNETILTIFNETIPEQIQVFEEQRQQSIEANLKYQDENDKQILDEIKENLEKAKDTENKLFVPKFLDDFINKFYYQLRIENETVIHEIVKNQLNYFFTWEILDITKDEILSKFKKTKTGYNAPYFLFDGTFNIVFKSAQKVGFDLSKYKNKLACYYPFQGNGKNLTDLKRYFGNDEIKQIIEIYNKYNDIRSYQSYNLIGLFIENKGRNSIEFNSFLELVKNNSTIKNDLILILKELNKDSRFSNYYLKYSLEILYNLGVEETYFKNLELNKPDLNYFKDILINDGIDEDFDKYKIINEFLIKSGDKEAFIWRIEQLINGFIEIPDYKFENGQVRTIYDLEYEINNHLFIKILEEYKYIDEEIEERIIKLIEKSFKEYDKYENYCKYIWQAVKYYLKNLSKDLEYNNKLIDKITDLLSNSENINKNISFKIILGEISDKFLGKVEKESYTKKYIEKIRKLENKLNNKNIINEEVIIITEGPTDYNYFKKAFLGLNDLGKINKNLKYFLNYLKETKNENGIGYSNTESNVFCLKLAQINPNKLIIGIFDTDDIPKDIKNIIKEKSKNLKEGGYFKTVLDNYFIILLKTPDDIKDYYKGGICTELLFGEFFLEGKIITKNFKNNSLDKNNKTGKGNLYDMGEYYLEIKGEKDSLVYDNYNFYNKDISDLLDKNTGFKSKMDFSENILNNSIIIEENILQNFQHIFDYISELIDIKLPEIQKSNQLKDNSIKIETNKTLIQKILTKIKSFFKKQKKSSYF